MERYAVLNVGSGEILSQWHTTEETAHADAAECESHETQPDCNVVRFSEWAEGKPLAMMAGTQAWDGAYPVVDSDLDMTGEIVSAQDQGYTVTACGMAVTRDADVIAEKIEQIEKALGPARASGSNPCGVGAYAERDGQWRISDDQHSETYATFAEALEAAKTWLAND